MRMPVSGSEWSVSLRGRPMPENDVDLLAIDRGMVTAPAGCGKTQLIANALARHSDSKPILVLTHTNAGVVALRGRLDRLGISSKVYRLATIDGWAMRLISTFPVRSAHNANLLKLDDPETDYPNIRVAAARLLRAEHINDILAASYARLFVDEYQDCSVRQHAIIAQAALTLPTCVLGDRLQAIFGFGRDELADWDQGVCAYFPLAGELETPWRWIKANSEPLGRWLLEVVRANLMRMLGPPKPAYECRESSRGIRSSALPSRCRRRAGRIGRQGGVTAHRPAVLRACLNALKFVSARMVYRFMMLRFWCESRTG